MWEPYLAHPTNRGSRIALQNRMSKNRSHNDVKTSPNTLVGKGTLS